MDSIITFRKSLLVAAVMAGGLTCHALCARAESGGYDGLIAPAAPDDNAPASNAAPKPDEAKGSGYTGVVAAPAGAMPTEETEKAPIKPPARDLETSAMINGLAEQGAAAVKSLKGAPADFHSAVHGTIAGKPDIEYSTKATIDQVMATVNNKNISDAERAKNVKKAYASLSSMAEGFRNKQKIPDSVFRQMGLSSQFISEEKAGNAASLAQLDAALTSLKNQ